MADWAATTARRVGLAWSGSTAHRNDRNRSLALAELIPHLPETHEYVCLQKELRDGDRAALQAHSNVKWYGDELTDFADTAALCELMDVVVSVDTSVAHLAGALGRTTMVMLPYSPDWRWMLDRTDSAWYPSLRLLRQTAPGDWSSVFDAVHADLSRLA